MRKGGASQKNTSPPFSRRTCPIELQFGMHKLEVLTHLSTRSARPRTSPQSRAISTGSELGRPPFDLLYENDKCSRLLL